MGILIALDLSISCSGICIFDLESKQLLEHHIIPIIKGTRKATKGLYNIGIDEEQWVEFDSIYHKFEHFVDSLLTRLTPYKDEETIWIAKEGYGFGGSSLSSLAEQGGVCLYILHKYWYFDPDRFIIITPSSVKKYATGKGKADKNEVKEGIKSKFGIDTDFWFASDDADAYAIGQIALMVIHNSPANKYEKELREKIIKNNKLKV